MAYISALVIRKNNTTFLDADLVAYGQTQQIPTPASGGRIDYDYWAVPITDGVVSGFNFIPTTAGATAKPTVQSFHVVRLIESKAFGQPDTWYVVGTSTQYIASAAAADCCTTPVAMPTTIPPLSPTQDMCQWNSVNKYFAVFGVPTLPVGWRLNAYGTFNNAALPNITNQTSVANLVTQLNSQWGATVGGTFALTSGVIVLTQTAGPGTDVISANLVASNPSA